jgi:nitroimidazol reductase NimA-like FMN-containing flavoprotein (pyridoxamine 5'-phosphate oxidase superfamily)
MLTERTKVRRRANRGEYDPDVIFGILDEALVCHVGFTVDAQPYVLPTAHARLGDRLYFHGAMANRMLAALSEGVPCCVTATIVDGLVFARSAFHHSMNYRSVVVLGVATLVNDLEERRRALHALVERLQPGRASRCRPPTDAEIASTTLVTMSIAEASAKIRTGPPIDSSDDMALPFWAGVVPTRLVYGEPEPAEEALSGAPPGERIVERDGAASRTWA